MCRIEANDRVRVVVLQEELDEAKEYNDPHSKKPIPLLHVGYILCDLAFPDFAVDMAPKFLDFLANIEFFRQMALKETKKLFPSIFEDGENAKRSGQLEQDIEDRLIRYTHEMMGLREAYWIIVIACCTQVRLEHIQMLDIFSFLRSISHILPPDRHSPSSGNILTNISSSSLMQARARLKFTTA